MNIILATDSYKCTHHKMYPKDTRHVFSYFESRRGAKYQRVLFFGLQYLLQRISKPIIQADVDEAEAFVTEHLGPGIFNREMWDHIVNVHGGKLPVEIRALPEGTVSNVNLPLMTIVNTDPKCAPLTNHLETWLSQLWYPCTVATISRQAKKIFKDYLSITCDNEDGIQFMLHDFGMRGTSSMESASIGGAAHILNFSGTDTLAGISFLKEFYQADEMPAFSVPASEHSVMTSLGEEGEFDIVKKMLKEYPTGILSVVSDSYNILKAVEYYATTLKKDILSRDGKFVIRPDSGDPVEIVLACLKILEEHLDIKINDKGYKVLPPQIGLIWGDGVDLKDMNEVLENMMRSGWAASNIIFGMGGGLLQKCNRDTMRFAFKASAIDIGGSWSAVRKNPSSDTTKSSKGGILQVKDGTLMSRVPDSYQEIESFSKDGDLELVFKDGVVYRTQSLEDIKGRVS